MLPETDTTKDHRCVAIDKRSTPKGAKGRAALGSVKTAAWQLTPYKANNCFLCVEL